MGNDEGDAAFENLFHAGLHKLFGRGIDRACRFVHHQNLRIAQHRAGKRDQLTLSRGKPFTALADFGVVLFLERDDEFMRLHALRSGLDLRVACVKSPVSNVVADGAREEMRDLRHHADLLGKPCERKVAQVDAIDSDSARTRLVETSGERDNRRLSSAG